MSDYSWNSNPWVWALTFRRVNEPPSGKPILFSSAMVRAILRDENPKTQTRRVMNPQPKMYETYGGWGLTWGKKCGGGSDWLAKYCPYGKPGDRLYVRETWIPVQWGSYEAITGRPYCGFGDHPGVLFAADRASGYHEAYDSYEGKWRPSIHMPKWASRITLEITEVRVQRVQEISEEDAIAEGCQAIAPELWYEGLKPMCDGSYVRQQSRGLPPETWIKVQPVSREWDEDGNPIPDNYDPMARTATQEFELLWDKINAKRGPKRGKVAA